MPHIDREKWITFVQNLNPDIDPKTIRLMHDMLKVSHLLHQIGENSLTAAGLSYAKYRLLMDLLFSAQAEGREELNPSEISQRQGTTRNTISALIRDLEEEGLIERHLNQQDRRKFNIRLTPAGRTRVQDHASRHLDIISECFSELSTAEQRTLSELLTKLRQSALDRACQPKEQLETSQ